ncbi:hypothetical protein [Nannocystis pusilla]|uniref:hypothetical protein n=1 Tax=Nannocystis pusilla TaxID=889268 RepID=UPI003B813F96
MDPQSLNEQKCRDIVATYRSERMPADARAAAWARLQAAIGEEDEAPPVRPSTRRRDLMWGAVLVAAAVLLLVVGARAAAAAGRRRCGQPGGARGGGDRHERGGDAGPRRGAGGTRGSFVGRARSDADRLAARAAAAAVGDASGRCPEGHAGAGRRADAAASRSRGPRPQGPGRGVDFLEQHAREFPNGHLVEERMLLTAQAQCELGRGAEARAAAAELVRAFPDSPHTRTVAGLCAE